eukprot:3900703-Pyramimonas_sp.AAC.1
MAVWSPSLSPCFADLKRGDLVDTRGREVDDKAGRGVDSIGGVDGIGAARTDAVAVQNPHGVDERWT